MSRYDITPNGHGGYKVTKRAGIFTWLAFLFFIVVGLATHAPLVFAIAGLIALFGILMPLRSYQRSKRQHTLY